jgi:putative flippase GtrA
LTDRHRGSIDQLSRYAFIGIVSNLAGYFVYLLITHLGATPKITMTLLYGAGAAIGYTGNRTFTFAHHGSVLGSGIRYLIAHFFGYLINFVILFWFVDRLGFPHQWVQAVAIFFVAGFIFIASKFFVFRNPVSSNANKS